MIENLRNLLALLPILLAATAMGLRLLNWLVRTELPAWERTAFGLSLGLGTFSYVMLVLGSMRLAYPVIGYIVVGAALLIGRSELRWIGLCVWDGRRKIAEHLRKMGWLERLLLVFLLTSTVVNLISALALPTGSDLLNYNFALPKIFLQTHQVGYVPSHRLSVTPFSMEMLWLLGMMLHSATVAQLLNWSLGLALTFVTGMLAMRMHSRKAGLVAASLVYAVTSVGVLSGGGKPELGGAFFLLLSVLALLRWQNTLARRWIVLAGVLAGLFAGTKLPNPLVVFMLVLAVTLYAWRHWGLYRGLSSGAVLGTVAAMIFGVWLVRAWLLTGNPVYPYLPTLFGGRDLPDLSIFVPTPTGPSSIVTSRGDPLLTPGQFFQYRHPLKLLVSPWTLSMDNARYRGLPGPIFLGLLPAVLLCVRRFPARVKFLLWLIPFLYTGWFFSYSMLRNVLAVLAILSVPTAMVFVSLGSQTSWSRRLMVYVLACWLAFSLIYNVVDARRALPVVLGWMTPEAWLSWRLPMPDRKFDAYPAYQYMNQNLPPNSKVLLWESRGFYMDIPYLRVLEFMYGLADMSRLQSSEAVLEELRRWDITHVAMTQEGKRLWLREMLEGTGKLDCVYKDDAMTVCRLPWASTTTGPSGAYQ
jgi:hypothetical protein